MTTTFNPADISGGTLSNGNLTVTTTAAGATRTLDQNGAGKYYFEYTMTTVVNPVVGLANRNAVLTTVASSPVNAVQINKAGTIFINGPSTGVSLGTITAGSVIGVAVDFDNKLIWFRVAPSGNWNNNAAYAPGGAGGLNIASILGDTRISPLCGFAGSAAAADTITANFGQSAFSGAVPAGYTGGFPASGVPSLVAAVTQLSLEEWGVKPFVNAPAQLSQIALEEWGSVNPKGIVAQVIMEEWGASPFGFPQAVCAQVLQEVWAPVTAAAPPVSKSGILLSGL